MATAIETNRLSDEDEAITERNSVRWFVHPNPDPKDEDEQIQLWTGQRLTDFYTGIEDLIDTHGKENPDPLFSIIGFTKWIPWGKHEPVMLVSAWSVRSPGGIRITQLHLSGSSQRVELAGNEIWKIQDGKYNNFNGHVPDQVRERKLDKSNDAQVAQTVLGRLQKGLAHHL